MTGQVYERLILDGTKMGMAFCPPLPQRHPRVVTARIPEGEEARIFHSTACWRRYVGTWEIKDGRFYLVKIEGDFELIGDGPLLADWFSGVLRIPQGEQLQYVHMGFGSVYERELHIKIEKGAVVASRVIDNRDANVDPQTLALRNLPGGENRFPGDDW